VTRQGPAAGVRPSLSGLIKLSRRRPPARGRRARAVTVTVTPAGAGRPGTHLQAAGLGAWLSAPARAPAYRRSR
jgi:hypothetical protein